MKIVILGFAMVFLLGLFLGGIIIILTRWPRRDAQTTLSLIFQGMQGFGLIVASSAFVFTYYQERWSTDRYTFDFIRETHDEQTIEALRMAQLFGLLISIYYEAGEPGQRFNIFYYDEPRARPQSTETVRRVAEWFVKKYGVILTNYANVLNACARLSCNVDVIREQSCHYLGDWVVAYRRWLEVEEGVHDAAFADMDVQEGADGSIRLRGSFEPISRTSVEDVTYFSLLRIAELVKWCTNAKERPFGSYRLLLLEKQDVAYYTNPIVELDPLFAAFQDDGHDLYFRNIFSARISMGDLAGAPPMESGALWGMIELVRQ